MSAYNYELSVMGFNNELKESLKCRIDYRKKAIYIQDVPNIDIKKGYRLFKHYQSGYKEEFLVLDVVKKKTLTGVLAIYFMRV
jgi:hypothetical protein